ncbi:MAG: hypothetical protein AB7N61_20790 [Acidimicrobiia bacterium]
MEVFHGVEASPGQSMVVYRPRDGLGLPVLLMFGDEATDPLVYEPLAVHLAARGMVVILASYDPLRAPQSSACALVSTLELRERFGGDPSRLAMAGVGLGAALAIGEAFGGPWTAWSSGGGCGTSNVHRQEPDVLVIIDGALDAFRSSDPSQRGLNPLLQVGGGNPYLRIRLLVDRSLVSEERTAADQFISALRRSGYDMEVEAHDWRGPTDLGALEAAADFIYAAVTPASR